jgi:glycine C-acetyltransferase
MQFLAHLGDEGCTAVPFLLPRDNPAATPRIAKAAKINTCFLIVPVFLWDEGNMQKVTLQSPICVNLLNVRQKTPVLPPDSTYFCPSENRCYMNENLVKRIAAELDEIKANGLFKTERIIESAQGPEIMVNGKIVLNFCANNYLGLSSHPKVTEAAKKYIDLRGYGMSSVRFICGTQDIHKELEAKISKFLGTEDTILYAAAFDANGGVFEPLFGEQDAIISDALNHASIIDGVRLCKAQRYRYEHNNMEDLEAKLKEAAGARSRIIVTDGSFSMDGTVAQLDKIVALAEQYDAVIMVDECHSSGFLGKTGRGTHEYRGVMGKIDIITGTLGKALGGASGGFTSGRKEIIEMLRQRSRPYLFSNTLAPSIVGASIAVMDLLSETTELRDQLESNTKYFRTKMTAAGFDIKPGDHPIVPIMLYDAVVAQNFAAKLLEEGIYVIGFFFPVVPKGQARIRVQLSAAHDQQHLDKAIAAFTKVGKELGVLK